MRKLRYWKVIWLVGWRRCSLPRRYRTKNNEKIICRVFLFLILNIYEISSYVHFFSKVSANYREETHWFLNGIVSLHVIIFNTYLVYIISLCGLFCLLFDNLLCMWGFVVVVVVCFVFRERECEWGRGERENLKHAPRWARSPTRG